MKRFFATLLAVPTRSKVVRDDGSFILSKEDIQRRRMVFVALFGLVSTVCYTALQVYQLGFAQTATFNLTTGIVGIIICAMGLKVSIWGDNPQPTIRLLLLAFSAMIWAEIAFAGGITESAVIPADC